ncbi:MAG: M56 family metallopeptidase [Puia sp.]|nr:M56 family metallopeptidase [Puia sp.]
MNIVVAFILKSTIAGGILFLYYLAALKNKRFHSYNRFYLLLSAAVSLVAPFIDIPLFSFETSPVAPPSAAFTNFKTRIGFPLERPAGEFSRIGPLLLVIAGLISISLLAALFLKIRWIYRMKKMYKNSKREGFTFIETDLKEAPFSFLSNLFWRQGLSLTDPNGENIYKHELAHITQRHTYDKLFMQIVSCTIWVNPFLRLLQRELDTVHEFIADAACIEEGETASFAKMLLYAHDEGRYLSPSHPSPSHPFFNSSLNRRLAMIESSGKTSFSYARRLLAIPIVLMAVMVIATRVNARSNNPDLNSISVIGFTLEDTPPPLNDRPNTSKRSPALSSAKASFPTTKKIKPDLILTNGYKLPSNSTPSSNPRLIPAWMTGHKSDPNPDPNPIWVTGHKLESTQSPSSDNSSSNPTLPNDTNGSPPAVTGNNLQGMQLPMDKSTMEVTVRGYKSTTSAKKE